MDATARRYGAEICQGCEVQELSQDESGVTVTARERTVRAKYVIGADGARSTVREEIGVAFEGFTYPERFIICPVTVQ